MASYVYILASRKNGTLYTGVTTNLIKRVYEHKMKLIQGLTSKYNVNKLVYYEIADSVIKAIAREKHIKNWKRSWKIELIEKHNPERGGFSLKIRKIELLRNKRFTLDPSF